MIALLFATLRTATPLLLAGLGGMFSERGGVVNLALEGILLTGAFTAATVSYYTGSATAGVLAAILAGALIAGLHALMSLKFRVDQVVSGVAINMLAMGLTEFLMWIFFDSGSNSPRVDGFSSPEALSGILTEVPILTICALLAVPIAAWVLFRTRFGLRLRSVGEHPEAADSLGIRVHLVQLQGVLLSGVLAGAGGAFLSLNAHYFVKNMSAGRGYIALAALIFGKWHPGGVLAATLLFGFTESLQGHLHISWLPVRFVQMLPYVLTMVALVGVIGRSKGPLALGRLFVKD
ncbi:MAG: ABC transporter permease [bacterium]|nr:ABC transporter permease [bacterium]